MHRVIVMFSLWAGLLPGLVVAQQAGVTIRPIDLDKWGATPKDVSKVLNSTATELLAHFPKHKLPVMLVEPKGGPIALHKRGPNGEVRIRLNTGSTYWSQYAFQFSHELCHVLCGYDQDTNRNQWFEESLCELASLYTLRQMSETWKTTPPYPHWRGFAPALSRYAQQRIDDAKLPAGADLEKWYREHAVKLDGNPYQRNHNNVVAAALLPLIEKQPEHWQAVAYINVAKLDRSYDFPRYLSSWHENCPQKHRPFVREIAQKFGVTISDMVGLGE